MAPKCEVCDQPFDDDDPVVQLESADLIHSACWEADDGLEFELGHEVAKRVLYSEIHEDWKR